MPAVTDQAEQAPMTIAEFAEKWRICRQTVYKEIREGRLRAVSIGSKRRITPEHEAHWIDRCSQRAKTTLQALAGAN